MATIGDLNREGFQPSPVKVLKLNIIHRSAASGLPFCHLDVLTDAPAGPGVYAWATDTTVRWIGATDNLLATVRGTELGLPGEDQTVVDAVSAPRIDDPAVLINALLNEALHRRLQVTWWWLPVPTFAEAQERAARAVAEWLPVWNGHSPAQPDPEPTPKRRQKAATPEPVVKPAPVKLVCPSCWMQVPAATRWCDDCEREVQPS